MSTALLLTLCVVGVNIDIADSFLSYSSRCPSLPPVLNGEVKIHCSGQRAVYKCNEGYSLHGASRIRRCNAQEQQPKWGGTAPECVHDGQWGAWGEWGSCSTTCGEGRNERRRVCDNPAPHRYGKECEGSAVGIRLCFSDACSVCDVKELRRISTRIADDGLTATFTCPEGFAPLGDETRTCDPETRNWTNNLFTVCGPVDPVDNGVFLQSSDSVIYFCNDGFNLIGSSERRCVDGIWTGAMPSCVETSAAGNLFGVHPVIPLKNGIHVVSSHVFYMAAAEKLTPITTPSRVPTTGANASLVDDPVQPALRSISFYYRIPDGKGSVLVVPRLLNLSDNATVDTTDGPLDLQASVHSNLTLTPVCIQLSSNLEESFRSRIQLEINVPTGSLFEMRSIETSQTDTCITKSGQCPEISNSTTNRCGLHCRHDGSCPGKMKCCSTSCGVNCVDPINASHVVRRDSHPDEDVSFECINDTSSGDCGFKSKVCTGGTAWELVHGDPNNPDEANKLPFTSSPGNECSLDVCLECLFPNADDDTVWSSFNDEARRRKRRDTHVTVGRAAFCLRPKGPLNLNWGTMPTERVSSKNTRLKFFVDMFEDGKHHMSVWLRCTSDDSVKIHLGKERSPLTHRAYHIPHFDNTGIHEVCDITDIKSMIDRQFHTDCLEYYVEFQVVAFGTPACVSSIFFSKD